jgi:hypothetical protein
MVFLRHTNTAAHPDRILPKSYTSKYSNNVTAFGFNQGVFYITHRISGITVSIRLNIMKKLVFVKEMHYVFSGVETVTFK